MQHSFIWNNFLTGGSLISNWIFKCLNWCLKSHSFFANFYLDFKTEIHFITFFRWNFGFELLSFAKRNTKRNKRKLEGKKFFATWNFSGTLILRGFFNNFAFRGILISRFFLNRLFRGMTKILKLWHLNLVVVLKIDFFFVHEFPTIQKSRVKHGT